jgi:selenocysteine lyase/cysteine desulfurase
VSTVALDIAAVRARFAALDRPTAFLDAPGGTQTPDEVIDAMAAYLRESNANLGGPFETSLRSDALVVSAHHTAARFLGCSADEVGFGQNMTTISFV